MSDILFTFEDGSEALMHYGVLGMKWGVRNAETQRRYAGGKGAKVKKAASKGVKRVEKTASRLVNDADYRNKQIKTAAAKAAGTGASIAATSGVKAAGAAALANPVAALGVGTAVVAATAVTGYVAYRKLKEN